MMVVALIAPLCQPPVCITPLAVVQNVMRDTPGAKGHGVCQAQDDHFSPLGGMYLMPQGPVKTIFERRLEMASHCSQRVLSAQHWAGLE